MLGQRSIEDLGRSLHEVTFCVIDIETTGGSAADGGITEIGAVKLRAGERLGTLQTLVNPGLPIPPQITVLTGITQAMVLPAPHPEEVLPDLLEFIGDAVIVGHNVRYDLGYINGALERSGRPRLPNRWIDTCALARRLVRDEVPNCRLGTLARSLRLPNRPTHRALDDALATGDLLHVLLERAAGLGVLGLDDLLALPKIGGHPQVAKLTLTEQLPRCPGVYLFRDRAGHVLYVGKASNLRTRVRSYFSGDDRRKVGQLLREVHRIDHRPCSDGLEAAVLEVRLIHRFLPRFNRQAKGWRKYAYLKLTVERFPRLSVVREVRPDGALYLGPLPSARAAQRVAEAIQTAVPIRRCTGRPGSRSARCVAAQIGVALCPCDGTLSEAEYQGVVERVRHGLTVDPSCLFAVLAQRMDELATAQRFEEAADMRDRASALAQALRRQRRMDVLRRAGHIVIDLPGGGGAELVGGRLVRCWGADGSVPLTGLSDADADQVEGDPSPAPTTVPTADLPGLGPPMPPPPRDVADELMCIAAWLDREAARVRLARCEQGLAEPYPPLPSFEPRAAGVELRR
jgi:DNA polymerase-3 subunit epsilon